MLRAFADASQSKDSSIISIAGFIGTIPDWSKAQRAWREVRKKSGIAYFHTTDFMSKKAKPYNTWTDRKRSAVFKRLTDLINSHCAFGVAVAVNASDFKALKARCQSLSATQVPPPWYQV